MDKKITFRVISWLTADTDLDRQLVSVARHYKYS